MRRSGNWMIYDVGSFAAKLTNGRNNAWSEPLRVRRRAKRRGEPEVALDSVVGNSLCLGRLDDRCDLFSVRFRFLSLWSDPSVDQWNESGDLTTD